MPLSASNETETLSLYKELLGEIERHCAELLASEVPSREAVWKARQAQDALYDAINKVSVFDLLFLFLFCFFFLLLYSLLL